MPYGLFVPEVPAADGAVSPRFGNSSEHARTLAISLSPSRIATISLRRSNSCSALVQMILFIAGIGLVIAGILASMIVMLMRDHENDTHIDTEQKAPLSAEPAGPRAGPQVNPAPAEEPQRGPAEPYDKEAAKATLESFVPNYRKERTSRGRSVLIDAYPQNSRQTRRDTKP